MGQQTDVDQTTSSVSTQNTNSEKTTSSVGSSVVMIVVMMVMHLRRLSFLDMVSLGMGVSMSRLNWLLFCLKLSRVTSQCETGNGQETNEGN